MRSHLLRFRAGLFLSAGLFLAAAASAWAAQSGSAAGQAPAPSPTPAGCPKAVFSDELLTGRDPFFPDSQRRRPQAQVSQVTAVAQPSSWLAQFQLKGIAWNKDRRLALINNATLAEGEKGPVKVNGQSIIIQCIEIRERSVLISIEGVKEVKEIRFSKEF